MALKKNQLSDQQPELKLSEERYRQLFDHIHSGVAVYEAVDGGKDFIIRDFNRAAEKIDQVRREDIIGRKLTEIFPGVKEFGLLEVFQRVWKTGKAEQHDVGLYHDERISGWRENYVYKLPSGEIVAVYDDVTESKKLEENLKKAESKYRTMLEDMNESYYELDPQGNFTFFNNSLCRYLGYSREELQGMNYKTYTPREEWADTVRDSVAVFQTGIPNRTRTFVNVRKDGRQIYVEHSLFPLHNEKGEIMGLRGVGRDVTERVVAENQILRSKNLLQSVLDSSPDWIYVKDEQHRFMLVNRAFASAHNAEPQQIVGKVDTDIFPEAMCLGDPARGIRGLRDDEHDVLQGEVIRIPDEIVRWDDGSEHVYDMVKAPLRDHAGEIYGVLVYRRDVTEQRESARELKESYDNLQKAFIGAVDALAATAEKRDPYTAGHQKRVSQLATAIAEEMNLPNAQVGGIKVAALIHDIGKIGVPSNILSKPGRLSGVEYSIVRTHPEIAYDILRTIDFPWPIAIMVLQHHERINGSGYPHGIPGDRMMLEARIIAVADVVEAMASHRPYRPSLGIKAALAEVEENKGKLYDADVVDACLRIFSRGFEFE